MIILGLLNVLYAVLDVLLVFSLPNLPEQALEYVNTFFDYLVGATGIVANYTPLGYLLTLFGVILAVDAGLLIYKFVMWVVRKIPMLGIK